MASGSSWETGPYISQLANNPVGWYPWGYEALNHASAEDKAILFNFGYSAGHWYFVTTDESFKNTEIAAFMNEYLKAG